MNLLTAARRADWREISAGVSTAKSLWDMTSSIREHIESYRHSKAFTVMVDELRDESAFDILSIWLSTQVPPTQVRRVEAKTVRGEVRFVYNSNTAHSIKIDGHPIIISIDTEAPKKGAAAVVSSDTDDLVSGGGFGIRKINFQANDAAGFEAVKKFVTDKISEARRGPRKFYVAGQYGWSSSGRTIDQRPMDSVILRTGIKEMLLADMRDFIQQEQMYIDLGIPWHRGYLFYGPPGTGKTSIAQAMAAFRGTHAYYLNLNSVENDTRLNEFISGISSDEDGGALLILEDIDTVQASQDREKDADGRRISNVSLHGLLNVLDGVLTPNGLISIMTTNKLESLDPALIRPGRADKIVNITYVDDDQLDRLCQRFLGYHVNLPSVEGVYENAFITPAQVVGIFKEHLSEHRHDAAIGHLRRFIESGGDESALDLSIPFHPNTSGISGNGLRSTGAKVDSIA